MSEEKTLDFSAKTVYYLKYRIGYPLLFLWGYAKIETLIVFCMQSLKGVAYGTAFVKMRMRKTKGKVILT